MGMQLEGVSLHDRQIFTNLIIIIIIIITMNIIISIVVVSIIIILISGEWALQVRDATPTRWATAFFEVKMLMVVTIHTLNKKITITLKHAAKKGFLLLHILNPMLEF